VIAGGSGQREECYMEFLESIDVPSCNSGVSPSTNPDVTAGHGPSMMLEPTWFRLVSGGI
jgi:hypothetical protein